MLEKIVKLLKTGERNNIELAYQLSLANKISLWPIERNIKDLLYYADKIQPPINFDNLPLGQLCFLLKEVIAISFSNSSIKQLPDCFDMMPSLVILEISCESLEKIGCSIGNLPNLKSLSIKNSKIDALKIKLKNLNSLESLNISFNNNLKTLPDDLYKSESLKTLRICTKNAHLIDNEKALFKLITFP